MTNIVIGYDLANFKSERAACLPYTVKNGTLLFLFAEDRKSAYGNIESKMNVRGSLLSDPKESRNRKIKLRCPSETSTEINGDITDMGGGVKKDEFALNAGLREFREESGGAFDRVCDRVNEMGTFIGGISQNRKMSVLFIPLEYEEWKHVDSIINPSDEVIKMIWVSENDLQELLDRNNRKMWKRVKCFYQPIITEDLKKRLKVLHVEKRM